jgi:hypothetical protein
MNLTEKVIIIENKNKERVYIFLYNTLIINKNKRERN